MISALKRFSFSITRACVKWLTHPTVVGIEASDTPNAVYVLAHRSLTDLVMLDIVTEDAGTPRPLSAIEDAGEEKRFFCLNRSTGLTKRHSMRTYSERMLRFESALMSNGKLELSLIPVTVFWGRAANKERSFFRTMFSEDWAMTSRLRRIVSLVFNRSDILVQMGEPLPWHAIIDAGLDQNRMTRRTARLLRVKFRNQRTVALGPDLSHRRTLVEQILNSRGVQAIIAADAKSDKEVRKLTKRARKAANSIASDMSYPTIRIVDGLLGWFWRRIYDGFDVHGIDRLKRAAETHTLIYTPSHRSHIDYLVLSYMLFHGGFMLPHIGAGDNLNMPVVGGVLRRCGAFFMRRSFQGDRLYAAIFSEYLYQVYRRGNSVEYFIEGGRTRTGRLLAPRIGMLQMTIASYERGIPRPIAFVPVYLGYEKLIEANSYHSELRGERKKGETVVDVFRNLQLIKQRFGKVSISFGEPLELGNFLSEQDGRTNPRQLPRELGNELLRRINACAVVNPINLAALVTLSMPKQAIDEQMLCDQIDCFRSLILADSDHHEFAITESPSDEIVKYVERLGMLDREEHEFGDILSHDAFTSVLMTWYRNNVLHVLALPSLLACLITNRRRRVTFEDLHRYTDTIFPYLKRELYLDAASADTIQRCLDHLVELDLIVKDSDDAYGAPAQHEPEHFRLRLLANVVMQIL
ncbi:MAG: glycerol-3-phosphate 1-O-acyltransferase PlsB, partial [Gammaproteobacteria bacterium]|nr:glycerol-3-phosphate 1-O-acyltransferase PlsB [Gammaproteobacteria bacterium]